MRGFMGFGKGEIEGNEKRTMRNETSAKQKKNSIPVCLMAKRQM
jgi:hypothetical protein